MSVSVSVARRAKERAKGKITDVFHPKCTLKRKAAEKRKERHAQIRDFFKDTSSVLESQTMDEASTLKFVHMHERIPRNRTKGSKGYEDHKRLVNIGLDAAKFPLGLIPYICVTIDKQDVQIGCRGSHLIPHLVRCKQTWLKVRIFRKGWPSCHANMIWFDHEKKQIELFAPEGLVTYRKARRERIDQLIILFLKSRRCLRGYTVTPTASNYPMYCGQPCGPQVFADDYNCGKFSITSTKH